jgi:hypothetical protein
MTTFDLNDIMEDKLYWLYANVGHGGQWLYDNINGRVEPEDGDSWGYYREGPHWYRISILDEKKALLYALRWA